MTFTLKNSVKSSWWNSKNSHLLTILDACFVSSHLTNSFLSCFTSLIYDPKMKYKWYGSFVSLCNIVCHCNIFPIQHHMTVTHKSIFTLKNPTDMLFWASSLKEGFFYYFSSSDLSMGKNLLGYLQHNPSYIPWQRCLNMNIHFKKSTVIQN